MSLLGKDGWLLSQFFWLTRKPAIRYRHIYPPRWDRPHSLSFVGGNPSLPKDWCWPIFEPTGQDMTFLAQVDCGQLPQVGPPGLLPSSGILYFFIVEGPAPLKVASKMGLGKVLYSSKTDDLRVLEPPRGYQYRRNVAADFRYLSKAQFEADPAISRLPRWEIEPYVSNTFGLPSLLPASLMNIGDLGAVADATNRASVRAGTNGMEKQEAANFQLQEGDLEFDVREIPCNWLMIEQFASKLSKSVADRIRHFEAGHREYGGRQVTEKDVNYLQNLREEASNWLDTALAHKRLEAPSEEQKNLFRHWCSDPIKQSQIKQKHLNEAVSAAWQAKAVVTNKLDLGPLISPREFEGWLEESVSTGAQAALCHSEEASNLIPTKLVSAISWQHRPNGGDLQTLGYPSVFQENSWNLRKSHVPLFQIGSNPNYPGLWSSIGLSHFWMTEADLRAGSFENAVVTTDFTM